MTEGKTALEIQGTGSENKMREGNYDLLRILSAFAVVALHVSATCLRYDGTSVPTNCHLLVMLLNHIVRFAVPCFLMLSGAFILADERNKDYKYFYRKSFKRIGIPGLVFSLLYTVFNIAKLALSTFVLHTDSPNVFSVNLIGIFKALLMGRPVSPLWYLFTLIGLYLAAPFVIRLAADMRAGGGKLIRSYHDGISGTGKRQLHNERISP